MRVHSLFVLLIFPLLSGWGDGALDWPHSGPMPDQPAAVQTSPYVAIGEGTKSYRPVEPMPWGNVNRRVAPPQNKSPSDMPGMHDGH
jgi:hypothetical protein